MRSVSACVQRTRFMARTFEQRVQAMWVDCRYFGCLLCPRFILRFFCAEFCLWRIRSTPHLYVHRKASLICFILLTILHLLPVEGNLKNTRNNAVSYSVYKSSLEAMGYSSDEVNLRQMAKEKASELTKTITDKAKGTTEEAADSAKAAVKNAADSVATKVTETAEKAKDAAIAAKDAAIKSFENGKSSSSTNSSSTAKK